MKNSLPGNHKRERINIIGCGNLGKTLGHLLVKNQVATIGSVCNSSKASTLDAINFMGQGKYSPSIDELEPADLILITTPDDLIAPICKKLSHNPFIKQGSLVLHCSGSLASDILVPMKEKGCYLASVHPMRSFSKPELSIQHYAGTYCAVEGDEEALPKVHALFQAIGSMTYAINKKQKSLYHASGVFASNYVVTLAEQALSCMNKAGIEHETAMSLIINLMRGTLSNLETTLSPERSLTGPIQRGDVSTLMKHLESLIDEEQRLLYSVLGEATLALTKHDKKEEIKAVLRLGLAT